MGNRKLVELLAPAGNPEALYGAVNAGADAVYLAGNRFGARAYADNFTTEELVEAIEYCHLFDRKVYLTVNTLLKESEFAQLYEYIQPFYDAGLDGVIIQDAGVFQFLREHFPGLVLHGSTQMSICTSFGADFLKQQGASRIVPARETSLSDLKKIKQQVDIELETFIHGAMCYCYSGQCLFSSILGGRSGNRGRCAQPCRLPFSVTGTNGRKRSGHFLSLKDMCTIDCIPDLIEAGIDSFKIEGRMKRAEYVAGVTAIYRKYIDSYYSLREEYGAEIAGEKYQVSKKDMAVLQSLYIRSEIQSGYYYQHNGREMITMDSPAYRENDEELLAQINNQYLQDKKRLPVTMEAVFRINEPALLTMHAKDASVTIEGDVVQAAQKNPITEENITKQLSKLGDTSFSAGQITVSLDSGAFFSLKALNEMRRNAAQALKETILIPRSNSHKAAIQQPLEDPIQKQQKAHGLTDRRTKVLSVSTAAQLHTVALYLKKNAAGLTDDIDVYLSSDSYLYETEAIRPDLKLLSEQNVPIFLTLPYIMRETEESYYTGLETLLAGEAMMKAPKNAPANTLIKGLIVRSLDELGFVQKRFSKKFRIRLDAGVYTWNQSAVRFFERLAEGFTIPYELNAAEQRRLILTGDSFDKIVYSHIPMMITANCVRKTTGNASCGQETVTMLTDRYGKDFPCVNNCRHCFNIIYNSVPFSLLKESVQRDDCAVRRRMDFTVEDPARISELLDAFLLGKDIPSFEHTKGHEKRGVE